MPNASPSRSVFACAALLALAIVIAWHNSLSGPLVLDDVVSIGENPSLRDLGKLGTVLSPPADAGVGGRPILNLSYALNYASTAADVRGFHLGNLLIHVLTALTLFALLRHLFLFLNFPSSTSTGDVLALTSASLWALHPVQTQSVTYLSQRAESLMGLFYFLTLYTSARAFTSPRPLRWQGTAVITCLLGLATKETMATAPLLVLLYDRTFCAGSFLTALRTRPRFYFALACTWTLLAVLAADVATRGTGTGHGISSFTYGLTQCRAIVDYLSLSVWPHHLTFDYGTDFVRTLSPVVPQAIFLLTLLLATLVALVRWPKIGFFGAWFFVILAPTSSIVPIAFSPQAESRLYLPLAALAVGFTLALHAWFGRRALVACAVIALAFLALTLLRNRTYQTDLALWTDTVAKRPANASAHYNLGLMLSRAGRHTDAAEQWRTTLRLDPRYAAAHNNLANALASLGQLAESVPHYEAAVHLQPDASVVRANFGAVLHSLHHDAAAEAQLRLAIKQNPANSAAYSNLGLVLERAARPAAEIIACYETALRLEPGLPDAHHNLALLLARTDRLPAALTHLETVVRLRPGRPDPRLNIVRVLLSVQHLADARTHAETAVREFPGSPDTHFLLGNCHALLNDFPAAVAAYERALALRPDFPDAQANLTQIRARLPAK